MPSRHVKIYVIHLGDVRIFKGGFTARKQSKHHNPHWPTPQPGLLHALWISSHQCCAHQVWLGIFLVVKKIVFPAEQDLFDEWWQRAKGEADFDCLDCKDPGV